MLPMRPRDIDEEHRASTPLELLFDLCFVVAVSQAADQLQPPSAPATSTPAVVGYLMVFFAIWWAWVNFTWFASAYDVDDLLYRLLTFVQIIGVLILAAGVDERLHHRGLHRHDDRLRRDARRHGGAVAPGRVG